jgi:hypothetical protein
MEASSRRERLRRALWPAGVTRITPDAVVSQPDDPTAWQPVFRRWLLAECVFREGCAGGVACLHHHFTEWCIRDASECPCTRPTFELLLTIEGFALADGLVRCLILKADATIALAHRLIR